MRFVYASELYESMRTLGGQTPQLHQQCGELHQVA